MSPWAAAPVDRRTKLDKLAPPDDTRDLDASIKRHGLLPRLPGSSSRFLNGMGRWVSFSGDDSDDLAGDILDDYLYLPGRVGGQTIASGGVTITDPTVNFGALLTVDGTTATTGTIMRALSETGGAGSVYFYPSSGSGVVIYRPNASDASRIGIRTTPSHQLHIVGELGSAGQAFLATSSGAAAQTMLTVTNANGHASTVPISVIAKSVGQVGNLQEWRDSGGVLSRITAAGVFDGPISSTSAITVTDSGFTVTDQADTSKTLKFELGSATAGADLIVDYRSAADRSLIWVLGGAAGNDLTFSTTLTGDRVITVPDATGTMALIDKAQTWTAGLTQSFPTDAATPGVVIGIPADAGVFAGYGLHLDDATGFVGEFQTTGLTANRAWALPNGSGQLVLSGVSATLVGNLSSTLASSTASSGASFIDNSTSTKRLRMVLSGATGNNSFTFTNTAARNYGFGNLSGNVVVVGDDAPAVASGNLGKVDLTGQTANIATTNLSSTPPAGVYAVEVYLQCTTADVTAGTLTVTIGWTDDVGATTDNTTITGFTLAATGRTRAVYAPLRVASGDLTYAVAITGAYGTAQYAIHVRTVSLG